jgi:hypothetical protein
MAHSLRQNQLQKPASSTLCSDRSGTLKVLVKKPSGWLPQEKKQTERICRAHVVERFGFLRRPKKKKTKSWQRTLSERFSDCRAIEEEKDRKSKDTKKHKKQGQVK